MTLFISLTQRRSGKSSPPLQAPPTSLWVLLSLSVAFATSDAEGNLGASPPASSAG